MELKPNFKTISILNKLLIIFKHEKNQPILNRTHDLFFQYLYVTIKVPRSLLRISKFTSITAGCSSSSSLESKFINKNICSRRGTERSTILSLLFHSNCGINVTIFSNPMILNSNKSCTSWSRKKMCSIIAKRSIREKVTLYWICQNRSRTKSQISIKRFSRTTKRKMM